MKTDTANTTKEALKPRKVGKGKAPFEKHIPFTGLMVFIREFQEPNPDPWSSSGGIKAKAQRWWSMSHTEKAPYEEKAAKLEAKHVKRFGAHNKNMGEQQLEKRKAGDEESIPSLEKLIPNLLLN